IGKHITIPKMDVPIIRAIQDKGTIRAKGTIRTKGTIRAKVVDGLGHLSRPLQGVRGSAGPSYD
ncbi:MAG: hypothetical protein NWS21_01805, partial [Burkholderiaceae bacterium]|nr:hypothetical protein [Burkholderiaceae bacterium]